MTDPARFVWRRLPPTTRTRLRPAVMLLRSVEAPWRTRPSPPALRPTRRIRPVPARSGHVSTAVSVVIPTRDAGPQFERVLAAVAAQRRVPDLEVVVADTASSDGTRERAVEAGATVIDVAPGDYGHGRTRNVAVAAARGGVLLMLVQDAVLLGGDAVAVLVEELEADPRTAAVVARQVPRADADLYGAFVVAAHEWMLASDDSSLRARAGVDGVCTALRRSAWEELRFADVAFAEDLELGVRAVAAGWSVRRSDRAAVAHSHNREPVYHFRRSAADRLHVAPLLADDPVPSAARATAAELCASGITLVGAADVVAQALPDPVPLDDALGRLAARLARGGEAAQAARGPVVALLGELAPDEPAPPRAAVALRDELLGVLASPVLRTFATAHPAVPAVQARRFVASLVAAVVGRAVGDALRLAPDGATAARILAGV